MADLEQIHQHIQDRIDVHVDQAVNELLRQWVRCWDEIADEWQAAVADIIAAKAEGGQPSWHQIRRLRRVVRAMDLTATQLDRLAEQAQVQIVGALPAIVQDAARGEAMLIAAQLPVLIPGWDHVDPDAMAAIVRRATQRITKLTRPLKADTLDAIRSVLIRGVAAGTAPRVQARQMVARVNDRFELGYYRAENIARTEMLDAHRQAALKQRVANRDVLQGWRWVCHPSERTCRACLSKHGVMYDVAEPGPDGHPRCRCTAEPVTKTWRDLGIDLDDTDRHEPETGEQWLRRQPGPVQDLVLTKAGAAAWRRGDWPASDWAVTKKEKGWRRAVYAAPPPRST